MSSRACELLGYPRDARLLILNADDLGMYPGVNRGIAAAVERGLVRSTSVIAPAASAPEALCWARDHGEVSLGVHLTLVNDLPGRPWRPLSPPERVPSLVDADGRFRPLEQLEATVAAAAADEVGLEFRAQLRAVLATGLRPTHLDWHCLHEGGRPDLFQITLRLAREHGLAVRVGDPPRRDPLQALGLPTSDHPLVDCYEVPAAEKPEAYHRMLRALPPGLTEWAMHPGIGDEATRVVDPGGAEVRRTDLEFLLAPETTRVLAAEGIVLVEYRQLRDVWLGQ